MIAFMIINKIRIQTIWVFKRSKHVYNLNGTWFCYCTSYKPWSVTPVFQGVDWHPKNDRGTIKVRISLAIPSQNQTIYPPWNWHSTWKWMVGRLVFFCDGFLAGAMLASARIPKELCKTPKGVGGLTTFHLRHGLLECHMKRVLGWTWSSGSKKFGILPWPWIYERFFMCMYRCDT